MALFEKKSLGGHAKDGADGLRMRMRAPKMDAALVAARIASVLKLRSGTLLLLAPCQSTFLPLKLELTKSPVSGGGKVQTSFNIVNDLRFIVASFFERLAVANMFDYCTSVPGEELGNKERVDQVFF